ncbi:MAG: 50S ribosomal protein L25 [Acidobacteriota bacterium]|nr:50S ribosomal protein L25 [Acidobacteriota bacterium]MDQ7088285.1 50S ribosomal protein L25 [Acidobacteriota bacterium]
MSQELHIEVIERDEAGKNASRRLRKAGKIPAVVYGGGRDPVSVQVDPRPIEAVLESPRGWNTLIQLKVGDRELKRMVMLRDVQRHPATEALLHADFVRVELDELIVVSVPVELTGTPVGVKTEGGLIDFVNRQVQVKTLPGLIPDNLPVDISDLHVGQHLEAKDLPLPEKVELVTPPTETICVCAGKSASEEEEAEAAAAAEAEAEAAAAAEAETAEE